MAKKDPKEYGKKFLEDLVALYPAEQQQAVRDVIAKTPETVITHAGEHILRQEDYSESMNAVQTLRNTTEQWRRDLSVWKAGVDKELEDGKTAVERLRALDASGGKIIHGDGSTGDGAGDGKPPAVDLSGYVKREDVDKLLNERVGQAQAYATNFGAYIASLTVTHLKEFDEPLDTNALIAFCREQNVQIDRGGYDAFVQAKRVEKAKVAHDAELKAAEDRGYKRGLNETSAALPFPTSPGSGSLSDSRTLAGLDKTFDKSNAVARAVETYHGELRRKEGGAS